MNEDRVTIPGSVVARSEDVKRTQAVDPNQTIEATIVVRRPATSSQTAKDLLSGKASKKTRAEMETELAAHPADMQAVADFARQHQLRIVEESPEKRMVRVQGPIQRMNAAFGIDLAHYAAPGGVPFLSYDGPLTVAGPASSAIAAVLGLHQQPVARPR